MRLIVFGATGKTGRHVCRVGVERGHRVTAFGRSVERLDQSGLDIRKGDVFDEYPFADERTAGFYRRFMAGEKRQRWNVSRCWLIPARFFL